jgi:hypothetical protein
MFHVRQGKYEVVIHELHKKYGPVVRIGPNVLDLDMPDLIKTIYNTKGDYLKVSCYDLKHWPKVLTMVACGRRSFIMGAVPKAMEKSYTIFSVNAILGSMPSRNGPSRSTIL